MSIPTTNKQAVEIGKANKRKYMLERVSQRVFLFCALLSVITLLLIIGFVFYKGAHPICSGGL